MALIIPEKPQIDFSLRTTKPFHNEKTVNDFFRITLSYGRIIGRSSMEEVSR